MAVNLTLVKLQSIEILDH